MFKKIIQALNPYGNDDSEVEPKVDDNKQSNDEQGTRQEGADTVETPQSSLDPDCKEAIEKEPIDKEPVDEDSADRDSVDEESIDKEPVEKEPVEKDSADRERADKESIDKEPIDKEPIDKEPVEAYNNTDDTIAVQEEVEPQKQEQDVPQKPEGQGVEQKPLKSKESVDSSGLSKESDAPSKSPVLGDNIIDTRENIIKLIIEKLSPYRGAPKVPPTDMAIYVTDPMIGIAMKDEFKDKLCVKLEDNELASFANGQIDIIDNTTPPAGSVLVCEGLGILFNRNTNEPGAITHPDLRSAIATLEIVEGMGSLESNLYELDSSQKARFHIGRGKVVKRQGLFRINDIIIKNDETDAKLKAINSRVSSIQADIVWKNGAFYLCAMPSGCRPLGGSATKICHDGIFSELRDTNVMIKLHDNDMIEFGGDLLLLFKIKQN
jgi:hypothetical protein